MVLSEYEHHVDVTIQYDNPNIRASTLTFHDFGGRIRDSYHRETRAAEKKAKRQAKKDAKIAAKFGKTDLTTFGTSADGSGEAVESQGSGVEKQTDKLKEEELKEDEDEDEEEEDEDSDGDPQDEATDEEEEIVRWYPPSNAAAYVKSSPWATEAATYTVRVLSVSHLPMKAAAAGAGANETAAPNAQVRSCAPLCISNDFSLLETTSKNEMLQALQLSNREPSISCHSRH